MFLKQDLICQTFSGKTPLARNSNWSKLRLNNLLNQNIVLCPQFFKNWDHYSSKNHSNQHSKSAFKSAFQKLFKVSLASFFKFIQTFRNKLLFLYKEIGERRAIIIVRVLKWKRNSTFKNLQKIVALLNPY